MRNVIYKVFGFEFESSTCAWAWLLMYAMAYALFCFSNLQTVLGIVIALIMLYLALTDMYYVIIPLAVAANSGLGTVLMGRISFPFYVMFLLVVRFCINRDRNTTIASSYFVNMVLLCVYAVHYAVFQNAGGSITDTAYLCIILLVGYFGVAEDDTKRSFFYLNCALTVLLSAMHCIFMGGVEYYEATSALSVSRLGIIGAGAGDPVFSGLLLLIGVALFLCNRTANRWFRYCSIVILISATITTISTTVLIMTVMLFVVYYITHARLGKGILSICAMCLACVLMLYIYNGLPATMHIEAVDEILSKSFLKYTQFMAGNATEATTYRSLLSEMYLDSFNGQSLMKKIFGGNSIPMRHIRVGRFNYVSHNTYIDLLLRFGILGTTGVLCIVVWRYIASLIKFKRQGINGELVLIKTLLLVYAYSVSIYYGVFFAFWFVFVVCF